MKHAHKHLIVAACVAALGLPALAQTAQPATVAPPGAVAPGAVMPGHPGMMQEQWARMRDQRRAQRQAALKQILQITPAQENAWNAWTTALRPANRQRPNRAEFAQLTTPERLDRLRALRATRNAEMDRRAEATKSFYAALTPSQQKALDTLTARRRGGGMGGRHGGWMHHRG